MIDNSSELSDDVLVAYADNEFSEDEMRRLAPLIEADEEATSKVDEFRQTGEQLRDCFLVDTSAVTPLDIAQKIRAMGGAQSSVDNLVSMDSYRQKLARGFRMMSSGAGLQKIAASLFIGVFVGIGGASQFGDYNQTGVTGASQIIVRGATASVEEKPGALLLQFGSRSFASGSTISKAEHYRIEIKTEGAEKISLIYHEKNEVPVTLIDRRSPGALKTMQFPNIADKGIKIDTTVPFVTFEVRLETKGQITRRFSVFGIK
jgi:hypothetical protein